MAWTEPRDWEGLADDGDEADRLGERTTNNRYSLNDQWSANLRETCPAKAQAAGDMFVGTGSNAIKRLAKGAQGYAFKVGATDLEWTDVSGAQSPFRTTAQNDLLVGNASGAQSVLSVPATGTKLLVARSSGARVRWEDI